MSDRLTDEQRRLIVAASRYVETPDRADMEREVQRETPLEFSHLTEKPCLNCGRSAYGVPGAPTRCLDCNRIHFGVDARDPYEPVKGVPRGTSSFYFGTSKDVVVEGLAKHPQPVVTALDPIPEGTEPPATVLGLQKRAEGLGWSVNLTYARGNGVHGTTGRPTKLVDSWAARCWRGRRRAVAVYSGGSWSDMWGIEHMFHARTLAQFETYLAGVDDIWLRRTRAENLMFEAHEPCTSGEVHGEHPWWKKGGAGRYCSGREAAKVKKTKEAGG